MHSILYCSSNKSLLTHHSVLPLHTSLLILKNTLSYLLPLSLSANCCRLRFSFTVVGLGPGVAIVAKGPNFNTRKSAIYLQTPLPLKHPHTKFHSPTIYAYSTYKPNRDQARHACSQRRLYQRPAIELEERLGATLRNEN